VTPGKFVFGTGLNDVPQTAIFLTDIIDLQP
jgi:hypothetical protein